jgi:hypothetical protein
MGILKTKQATQALTDFYPLVPMHTVDRKHAMGVHMEYPLLQ